MDDTQNYLNQILKKRLGSVVNYSGSSNTVTRIPKQQQKVQNMPTVFRKKHQTVYVQNQNSNSYYSQAQSQYLSMKQGTKVASEYPNQVQQMPQQNKQTANQRVEYMLISKRIQNRKQDEFISPTVDVTNYQKSRNSQQYGLNKKQKQHEYKSNIYTSNPHQITHSQSEEYFSQRPSRNTQQTFKDNYNQALGSRMSSNTDRSKRKKIF